MIVTAPPRIFSLSSLALAAVVAVVAGCAAPVADSPLLEEDGPIGEVTSELTGLSNVTAHGTTSFASASNLVTNDTNGWADVPRLFVGADAAAGDALEITVTADVETTGSVWFRAVVDEQVALPSDVLFFSAGSATRGTRSFTFVLPNVTAGYHLVRIQSYGRGSKVRARSLSVRAASSSTALARSAFVVPTSGPSIYKTTAGWANIPGLSYPITTSLTSEIEATISAEVGVSAGRMLLRVLVDGVPAQPGDITLVQSGVTGGGARSVSFRLKDVPAGTHWIPASARNFARRGFPNAGNGDNRITPDELVVQICQPQNSPYGTAGRWATATLDGGTSLSIMIVDCYMSTLPSQRIAQAGVLAHEYFHETIGAYDFYGDFPTINANDYSLMDNYWPGQHLDPYHKIRSGWLEPTLASVDTWTTRDVSLPAVEDSGEALVIYKPSRNDREYFILENRYSGALPGGLNYDGRLPRSGVAVWHVIEDTTVAALTPPGVDATAFADKYAEFGWAVGGVRFGGVLAAGEVRKLEWADGSSVGITLTAIDAGTNPVTVRVAKPTIFKPPIVPKPPSPVFGLQQ